MRGGARPKMHRKMPAALQDLVARCWAPNYSQRPSFIEIVAILQEIIAAEFPVVAVDRSVHTATTITASADTASTTIGTTSTILLYFPFFLLIMIIISYQY